MSIIKRSHVFLLYFFNMDISLNICFRCMKFVIVVHNIPFEGSISQNFDYGLSSFFMEINRVTLGHFLKLYFLDFIIKKTKT